MQNVLTAQQAAESYGISQLTHRILTRNDVLPSPDITTGTNHWWSPGHIAQHHSHTKDAVAAVVPFGELAAEEWQHWQVYACPSVSSRHIVHFTPSVIGLVGRGGATSWHHVRAVRHVQAPPQRHHLVNCGGTASDTTNANAVHAARVARGENYALTVHFLNPQVGSIGGVTQANNFAVRRGRILARNGNTVGAPGDSVRIDQDLHGPWIVPRVEDVYPASGVRL